MTSPTDPRAPGFSETLYTSLCAVAEGYLRRSRPDTAILPAELVHECYLKLRAGRDVPVAGSLHFRALASAVIRQVLVDRIRARRALKRGGGWERVELDDALEDGARRFDVLALDDAVRRLAELDARQARIVELRFFGGLSIPQVAEALGVSPRTVDDDWTVARAWLRRAIEGGAD